MVMPPPRHESKEIQDSESLATLAARLGINIKTVRYWRDADTVEDKKSGPRVRKSVLSDIEQQAICTVRRHTQLALDDLFIVFKARIPALTRSNLHRCLQHHGLSRLPKDPQAATKKPFKPTPLVTFTLISLKCIAKRASEIFVCCD